MDTGITEPVLFTYDISVFGRRMDRYLSLRNMSYYQCIQPPNMPRPDLAALGINHRRIPLMAIGRDIYVDTRLIIEKLEGLFPQGKLGSNVPFEKGLEQVMQGWAIDAGPFWRTAGCIPVDAPIVNDPIWMKDRFDGSGGRFTREVLINGRAECLANLRLFFQTVEYMMADGRKYLLRTEEPSLADVHGIWCFDWATHMALYSAEENIDQQVINKEAFPHVFAWVDRFRTACAGAVARNGKPKVVSGVDVKNRILSQGFTEVEGNVDEHDPLKLKKGQVVRVSPVDFGFTHADEGMLVALSATEVVISVQVPNSEALIRLHFPRINFKIVPVD